MGTERRQTALLGAAVLWLLLAGDARAMTLRRSVFAGSGWSADRTLTAFSLAHEPITGRSRAGGRVLWHGFLGPGVSAASAVATKPVTSFALEAPAPNPCSTRVALRLRGGLDAPTALVVYDVRGRTVRRLMTTETGEGRAAIWNLDDGAGHRVAAGVYFVRTERSGPGGARAILVLP